MWLHQLFRLVKWLWAFSFLIFFIVFFWTYASLGETLRIPLDNKGNVLFLQRDYYYYYISALFLMSNIFVIIIGNLIAFFPDSLLPVPNRSYWISTKQLREEINWRIKRVFSGIGLFMNLFLTWICWWIFHVNSQNPSNFTGTTAATFVTIASGFIFICDYRKTVKSAF
ncbi:MAG: hypothetical protein NZM38_04365 [Cytophagales bacterium]|nr:hypothetical protein [Cytophagales bacterium]MDW8383986.1 hypothetical protein [Flammeovirgaceae bacterium]